MRTTYMRIYGKPWGGFIQDLRRAGSLEQDKLTAVAVELRGDPDILTEPGKERASLAKLAKELGEESDRLTAVFSAASFLLSELYPTTDKVDDFLEDLLDLGVLTQGQKCNLHLLFDPLESCKRQVWRGRQKL